MTTRRRWWFWGLAALVLALAGACGPQWWASLRAAEEARRWEEMIRSSAG